MNDDLGPLKIRHRGRRGMGHVRPDVDRIDAAEARGVQVHQVVESVDDAVDDSVRVRFGDVTVFPTWEDVVQVASIDELALMSMKARHVQNDDSNNRTIELLRIELVHEIVNDANAVELIAVNGRRQSENGAVSPSAGNQHRQQNILGQPIGHQVDIEARHFRAWELLDHELPTTMNGARYAVVNASFHAASPNSATGHEKTHVRKGWWGGTNCRDEGATDALSGGWRVASTTNASSNVVPGILREPANRPQGVGR